MTIFLTAILAAVTALLTGCAGRYAEAFDPNTGQVVCRAGDTRWLTTGDMAAQCVTPSATYALNPDTGELVQIGSGRDYRTADQVPVAELYGWVPHEQGTHQASKATTENVQTVQGSVSAQADDPGVGYVRTPMDGHIASSVVAHDGELFTDLGRALRIGAIGGAARWIIDGISGLVEGITAEDTAQAAISAETEQAAIEAGASVDPPTILVPPPLEPAPMPAP